MSLEKEIEKRSQEISTDAYAMSVGELASLYRDKELDIHPEFQRFFRWTAEQKTKFIESLLLGIPTPSIFVSQTKNGKWDVVDGLQRISTVLELMGELKGEDGKAYPPLVLQKTKYLPSLEGMVWKKKREGQTELPSSAILKIKRARFDIKIVLNTSDSKSKYELFQRLNTGGSIATDQEVRNCMLIMVNKSFYLWLDSLRKDSNFQACLPISERLQDEQYDMDLVVRFITLYKYDIKKQPKILEVGTFLTDEILKLAEDAAFNKKDTASAFAKTFKILANALAEDSFKKFDIQKQKPVGPVLISMFEVVALGIGYHCNMPSYTKSESELKKIHQGIWQDTQFTKGIGSGVNSSTRIPRTIAKGRRLYKP